MDLGVIKVDPTTTEVPLSTLNINQSDATQSNVELVKAEPPEDDDIELQLLQHIIPTIKSETADTFKPASSNTLEVAFNSRPLLELKLETAAQNSGGASIKQELDLLHEELDIKCEDETIQDNKLYKMVVSGVKPFKCCVCNYMCRLKSELNRHLRTHTGENSFTCHVCDKSFGFRGSLKSHLRIHTGEKPFKCNTCDKRFGRLYELKTHITIHTGEKLFKCHNCDKGFRYKNDLQNHLRIHTGEKPFKCNICEYSFRQNCQLTLHLRTHTGAKPYKCNVCNKLFTLNRSLKRHIITHSQENPF